MIMSDPICSNLDVNLGVEQSLLSESTKVMLSSWVIVFGNVGLVNLWGWPSWPCMLCGVRCFGHPVLLLRLVFGFLTKL